MPVVLEQLSKCEGDHVRFEHDGTFTVCGMERSGSTFVYQVLKAMNLNVRKTHCYEQGEVSTVKIYTFRDPRDVICSYARSALLPEIKSGDIYPTQDLTGEIFHEEPLRVACYRLFYRPNARQLDYRCYMWEAAYGAPVVLIKYEDYFKGNELKLVKNLSTFCAQFGYDEIGDAQALEIVNEYSITRNRVRAGEFKSFDEWNEDTQIHGDHISNNGESSWKREFNFEIAAMIDKFAGDFIIELGYEKNREWIKQFADATDEALK